MQTLIPPSVKGTARPLSRAGRVLGFGLTTRALLLLCVGFAWAVPAFFSLHRIWFMVAWDGMLLVLFAVDAAALPSPARLAVTRRFLDSPRLGDATRVELELVQDSARVLECDVTDALDASLMPTPEVRRVQAFPRDPVRAELVSYPGRRGEVALGDVFLRYRAGLKLVERWAVADAAQTIRVFPAMDQDGHTTDLHLMRARQIALERRRLRLRGLGREFESLRDYQPGDELRNVSWPATARRAKPITRQFTVERSQQVWVVLDAGRLSRTAFQLVRRTGRLAGESVMEADEAYRLSVTQLDQAATAAVMLATAVGSTGDKCGLLTYGRAVQQQLLPGAGPSHLRVVIDQLSQVRSEAGEANHMMAAQRLRQLQRRRGLVVWITELSDSAGRPEVVAAVLQLVRRHLVLLVLLYHPELEAMAARDVGTVEEMYVTAAAKEVLDRRREEIARLRQRGVLVVEATPGEAGVKTINGYLDVKARGLL